MTAYFVETDPAEEEFFTDAFADCTPRFVPTLHEVKADAELLSTFIHSKIDDAFLRRHPKLKLIAIRSSGYDHVDLPACEEWKIAVCYTPHCSDETVAEHAFALILALSRRTGEVLEACKRQRFSYAGTRGFDVKRKTLGVIGAGRIGSHVIRFGKAFGMRVIADDIRPQAGLEEKLGFCYASFDELLRGSHIISLHVPLTEATYHLLDRDAFQKCRRGVIIVNTARGRLIDTEALAEALDKNVVAGAGLDVIEEERVMTRDWSKIAAERIISNLQAVGITSSSAPSRRSSGELNALLLNKALIARPNVIFTPHIAFNSVEAVARINQATVENIKSFIAGESINLVPRASAGSSRLSTTGRRQRSKADHRDSRLLQQKTRRSVNQRIAAT